HVPAAAAKPALDLLCRGRCRVCQPVQCRSHQDLRDSGPCRLCRGTRHHLRRVGGGRCVGHGVGHDVVGDGAATMADCGGGGGESARRQPREVVHTTCADAGAGDGVVRGGRSTNLPDGRARRHVAPGILRVGGSAQPAVLQRHHVAHRVCTAARRPYAAPAARSVVSVGCCIVAADVADDVAQGVDSCAASGRYGDPYAAAAAAARAERSYGRGAGVRGVRARPVGRVGRRWPVAPVPAHLLRRHIRVGDRVPATDAVRHRRTPRRLRGPPA
ncbi:hypothetical protein HK405_002017, partial [Cladochytrium tenue]